MKNKKIIIIVISIILILAISVGIGITIYFNNKPKNKPEDVLQTFASYINDKKYEDMYSLLSSKSKANISEEDFIKRNKNDSKRRSWKRTSWNKSKFRKIRESSNRCKSCFDTTWRNN